MSTGCILELFLLPFTMVFGFIGWVCKRFKREIGMLALVFFPYMFWGIYLNSLVGYVPLFTMELNLLSKFGLNLTYECGNNEIIVVLVVYLCIILLLNQISQWTVSACYGCIASLVISSALTVIAHELSIKSSVVDVLIWVISFIVTVLAMRRGFHSLVEWISPNHEIASLAVGIIPTLLITFVTFCNLFTIAFREAVVGTFGYVVAAIVLDVVVCGIGVFLYLKFKRKYFEIMAKKLGVKEEDTYVVEEREIL